MADEKEFPDKLIVFFDGSCEPRNPGGWSTYGWCIQDAESGDVLAEGHGVVAKAGAANSTNNYAEYSALGFALRFLLDRGWTGGIEIRGDSKLVVNQITDRWACNKDHLRKLRDRCRELLKKISLGTVLTWIPREQNEYCDALSQKAYTEATGKPYPERRRK
jgi:ribonuclease HI